MKNKDLRYMNNKKQHYETPTTDVWVVCVEQNLLQFCATRDGYGAATTEDWE